MVRIIMKNPDGTLCGHPEDIYIKRNGQSESFYRMLEEYKVHLETDASGDREKRDMDFVGK